MFELIRQFWISILQVFVRWNDNTPFTLSYALNSNGSSYYSSFSWNPTPTNFVSVLSGLTLIGLSIFLFYQVYKVIHAFIGGFYEDVF